MSKTLSELFSEYQEECEFGRRLRPQTIRGYKHVFEHFTNTMPHITHPEQIKREELIEFFKRIETRKRTVGKGKVVVGLKKSTIHTYAKKLESFFEWLRVKNLIENNPIKEIKLSYPQYTDCRRLKKEDVQKINTAIMTYSKNHFLCSRNTALISCFLYTGIRKGELLGLCVTDLDLKRLQMTVRAETSKSNRTRQVPINPVLRHHLEDYFAVRKEKGIKCESLFVSGNTDSALTEHGLKHLVTTLSKQSGVKFHVHQYRHTFACMMAKSAASVVQIQKALGHTDIRMTESYLRSMGIDDYRNEVLRISIDNLS